MFETLTPERTARMLVLAAKQVGTLRFRGKPETLLHRTADSFAPTLAVAFRYAIERAKARLRATKDADLAAAAMRHALEDTLPGSLIRAMVAGADTGISMLPRFRYAAEYTATDGPLQFRFSKTDPQAVKWARKHGAELAKNISETTRQRIKDALVAQSEGTATFDDVIASVGDNERARTIARHESMVATSEGQRQAWEQAVEKGLLTGRERRAWIATGDDKICPICEELDGAVAGLDGEYPGEGGEGPPAHVNCRCTEGIVG